ncbi:MAG: hypothetical protein LC658_16205, partial [Bacteroidales bacterium]|nr:hypothetical protein [Bacteroidales bacterium]
MLTANLLWTGITGFSAQQPEIRFIKQIVRKGKNSVNAINIMFLSNRGDAAPASNSSWSSASLNDASSSSL